MQNNKRSQIVTQGVQRSPNRAMLRAVGFKDEDFEKPIIGVASGYSNITPCNDRIDVFARVAMESLRAAGGMLDRKSVV